MIDILTDAGADALKMLPFLFAAFAVIEMMENYSAKLREKVLGRAKSAGPVTGAILGCIPQCGFSVMAAELYACGIISIGTLLAVFIATSDEAVLIMMGNPGCGKEIMTLLAVKTGIAVIAGYAADTFLSESFSALKKQRGFCMDCGCHKKSAQILIPVLQHTVKIFLFLFLFSAVLNLGIQMLGIEKLSEYLLSDTWLQPAAAAFIGLLPNCAASVILTQLYLKGVLSFASVIAGLCTGAGAGLIVLFRMNRDRRENVKILLLLYGTGMFAGILLDLFV